MDRVLGDLEGVDRHAKRDHHLIDGLPTAADRAQCYVEIIGSVVARA